MPALKGIGECYVEMERAALARYFHGRAVDYCEQALTYLTRSVTASLTAGRVD